MSIPYKYYCYALYVLEGRFLEGEAVIATDAHFSYRYAVDVVKSRFPEGEAVIATDANYSYRYALYTQGALEVKFVTSI